MKNIIGNAKQKRELLQWFSQKESHFIVLHGITGIGKTALAVSFLKSKNIQYLHFDYSKKLTTREIIEKVQLFGMSILHKMTNTCGTKCVIIDELEILHESIQLSDILQTIKKCSLKALLITQDLIALKSVSAMQIPVVNITQPCKHTIIRYYSKKYPNYSSEFIKDCYTKTKGNMMQLNVHLSNNFRLVSNIDKNVRYLEDQVKHAPSIRCLNERTRLFTNDTTNVNSMIHRNYLNLSSNVVKISEILAFSDTMYSAEWEFLTVIMCVWPIYYMNLLSKDSVLEKGNIWSRISHINSRNKVLCKAKLHLANKGHFLSNKRTIQHLHTFYKIKPRKTQYIDNLDDTLIKELQHIRL